MGAVNTTYTFTATDTITSTKMNNIIDQTTITDDAIIGTTLEVASGQLKVRALGITSNEIANGQVTSDKIADGTIVNADISPTAAIAGTKISPAFGSQNISATGNLVLTKSTSDTTTISAQNTSGVTLNVNAIANTEGNIRTATNHPLTLSTNNSERMRITDAGNVGVNTNNPNAQLEISRLSSPGSATFSGGADNLRLTAAPGSSFGEPSIKFQEAGTDVGAVISGKNTANGAMDIVFVNRNTSSITSTPVERMRITAAGNVGIGKTTPSTMLDVNGTVTATAFAGPLTGNVTGDVTGTATTVSNGAITAAKLDGAQSGSAPIFGVRAWVNFNGTSGSTAIRQAGNVSSVTRNALGRYTITFSTAMQDTNYAIVGFARDADNSGGNYFVSALSGDTKTTSQVQIEVNSTGGTVDSPEINLMVIR